MNPTDFLVCLGVIGLVVSGGMSALMLSDVKKRLNQLSEKIVDDTDVYTFIYSVRIAVDCTMTISVVLLLIAIPITMLVIYAG